MSDYTICPDFLKLAGSNKSYLYDVLYPFIPGSNNKKILIDEQGEIIKEYEEIIKRNKEKLILKAINEKQSKNK